MNAEDPLNKEAAEVLQNNRRVFEQNVAKAMRGGYVGSYYFERCLKWYNAGAPTLYTIFWSLANSEEIPKNRTNEGRRDVIVVACTSVLYILTFFTSCQASKHIIHQVFYAFV